jgi:hypothetical protein
VIGPTRVVVNRYVPKTRRRPFVLARKDLPWKKTANRANLCTLVIEKIREAVIKYVLEKEKMRSANANLDLYLAETRHASQYIHATEKIKNSVLKSATRREISTNVHAKMALNWIKMRRHVPRSIPVIKKITLVANTNVTKLVRDLLALARQVSRSRKMVEPARRFILATNQQKVVVLKPASKPELSSTANVTKPISNWARIRRVAYQFIHATNLLVEDVNMSA